MRHNAGNFQSQMCTPIAKGIGDL